MENPIAAHQNHPAGNQNPNPNPNIGDRSHSHPNPADDRDQRLQRLFSVVQSLAASRDSSDGGQRSPVSVEPPASSISWKRPVQTDFFREVSLFNAHFGSEPERSRWAQFLPEYLRPGNLENYLKETKKPRLFCDNFWWASQESSGQGDLPPPSCRQSLLCQQQPILRTTTAPTRSNTADGLKTYNRRKMPVVKDGQKNLQSFNPFSRRSDHIQYSRDQLFQLREAKSLSEAILKIKQEIEVEFGRINQIIDRGTILVDRSGAQRERGSTSKKKKEEKKVARITVLNAKEGLKTGDKAKEEVASITVNAKEEPKTGDKAKEEEVSKTKRRIVSKERKARKKMKERKKRAEKNRKLGVKRLRIQHIQKQKPVSPCRHYLKGRCTEGEACKFSHDVVPLTKSKPCCHFARQGCLKGDDCPFDHQLSKYPCNNYVSTGFCNRGESCLFSHEITPCQIMPEAKSLNPSLSDSIPLTKSPSTVETGKGTLAIGAVNKHAQETKGFFSSGNFPLGTSTNHKQANLSLKSQLLYEAGAPSGTSEGTTASRARSSVQAYPMEHIKDNISTPKANEAVKPPKGFTFLNVGNLLPNDSARGVQASQKTSNGVEAGVLLNQNTISNVSILEKISEAPSVPTSNMTGIFTFGKSSSEIHGEKKQLSFPTFGNSSLVASAGDKKDSVDTAQKANVAPFKLSGLTSSSTPFLTRLDNAQGKNTISSGQRSLLSTLGFASKCGFGATRSPLSSTPAFGSNVNKSSGTDHIIHTQQTKSPINMNPSVGAGASSDVNKNSGSSNAGSSMGHKKPANPFETWEMLYGGNSQSKP